MNDNLPETISVKTEDDEFLGNMVFRHWWKLSGKPMLLLGFSGTKEIPQVEIKINSAGNIPVLVLALPTAHLLCDALIHVLKTMEPDRHGDGCPTFLQPSE